MLSKRLRDLVTGERPAHIVPSGRLLKLKTSQLKPNPQNPRQLFDREPLAALKENIRTHGVLVPITVYQMKGQEKFAILDGERRYRCCVELEESGVPPIEIPANIVEQPDKVAGLLYMFSIHNFREQWELMPVAYGLQTVMRELGETTPLNLHRLTGLSMKQIDRCKMLLAFPDQFQKLSLDPDPTIRIPANFWIELYPVLEICERELPDVVSAIGRDGVTERFVDKYRDKKVRSVIHFRRIVEAFEVVQQQKAALVKALREYVTRPDLETRASFDPFLAGEATRVQNAIRACHVFIDDLAKAKIGSIAEERAALSAELVAVREFVQALIDRLEGTDAPAGIVTTDNA